MIEPIQLGVIGAIQRTSPAIAALWLEWTGIPGLDHCEFRIVGDNRAEPQTAVYVHTSAPDLNETRELFCDFVMMGESEPQRRQMPIIMPADVGWHKTFWGRCLNRDAHEVQSPLEFWWMLALLRNGGPLRTSAILLQSLGLKYQRKLFTGAIVELANPSLDISQRTPVKALPVNRYIQPTSLDVHLRLDMTQKHVSKENATVSIPLDDEDVRDKISTAIVQLALSSEV